MDALDSCDAARTREMYGIHCQWAALKDDIQQRIYDHQRRCYDKEYESCGRHFAAMEKGIQDTVAQDLELLRS